jgi:hypothetical protein
MVSISNNGRLTNMTADFDEMKFVFGVSNLFFYRVEKNFALNEILEFPTSVVSFPCFTGEALWFQALEVGATRDSIAQIGLDCSNLQIGTNTISMEIEQAKPTVYVIAKVFRLLQNIIFSFLSGTSPAPLAPEIAVYSINLNVTAKCTDLAIVTHDVLQLDYALQQFISLPDD